MRTHSSYLLALTTLFTLSACTSIPVPTPEKNVMPTMPVSPLVSHMLFFDFDSTALPNDTLLIIAPHIKYLIQHPTNKVLIEGYADEDGSRAYNINLGLLRAKAVKNAFIEQGISETQLLIASKGEQRPLNHEEKPHSNARNRRVTLTY